uniref:Putative homing endonuclease n=1 Tax=viral metagenome TaxID=1070528 RepID=A0A6H1Z9W5_9ZZZZ
MANRHNAATFESRLKLNPETGCIEWQGYRTKLGYGQLSRAGKRVYAHRVAFEAVNGAIPDGLHVCHRCDNPACCNQEHLFLGTHLQNMADRTSKRRAAHGQDHYRARLSEDDVRNIRALYAAGHQQADIAERYGTDQGSISAIVNRRKWRHIP